MSPEELQPLNERFQAMARSDAGKQAPAHVEAALLAAFSKQSKPRVVEIRRKRPVWLWVAAAAAVVIVIFGVSRSPRPQQEVAAVRTPSPVPALQSAPPVAPAAAPAIAKVRTPRPKAARTRPIVPVREQAVKEKEVVTDFIPVTPGELLAPEESGRVIRVKLPRSALAAFGLPMNVEKFGERIPADVLLGEDGSTRAVRFVQTVSYR